MANGLLDGISASHLSKFRKDFLQMVKVSVEIDRHYGKSITGIDSQIKKFEKLAGEFSKKYGIILKAKKSVENFTLRIFIKEPSLKDFFANSASKISGLKAIGRTGFNQADVSDMDKFSKSLDSVQDRIFVSYSDAENGTGSFAAFFDRRENMVELIYDAHHLAENSAVFKICAYYALKDGVNGDFDIHAEACTFGFENLLNEIENREWYDKVRQG